VKKMNTFQSTERSWTRLDLDGRLDYCNLAMTNGLGCDYGRCGYIGSGCIYSNSVEHQDKFRTCRFRKEK